jgi:hypothetical protein
VAADLFAAAPTIEAAAQFERDAAVAGAQDRGAGAA